MLTAYSEAEAWDAADETEFISLVHSVPSDAKTLVKRESPNDALSE